MDHHIDPVDEDVMLAIPTENEAFISWKPSLSNIMSCVCSIQVFFDGCSEEAHLNFDGERYNLYQIHIHSPSEHAVRRKAEARNLRCTLLRCPQTPSVYVACVRR